MSNFCKDCSEYYFGEDFHDLAGISTPDDTAKGLYASVVCEGCGFTQVDHEGVVPFYDPSSRDEQIPRSKCVDLKEDIL